MVEIVILVYQICISKDSEATVHLQNTKGDRDRKCDNNKVGVKVFIENKSLHRRRDLPPGAVSHATIVGMSRPLLCLTALTKTRKEL